MMRTTFRSLAGAALAATVLAADALAEEHSARWYTAFTGLYNMPSDSQGELDSTSLHIAGDIELSNGLGFALALGVQAAEGLRVELEGAYRPFDIDGVNDVRVNGRALDSGYELSGDVDTWSLMLNAHYDIAMGAARPYIGAGLGIARHDANATLTLPILPATSDSGNDNTFAYQFMAGLGYELSDNMVLFGGYRYMGTDDLEIEALTASYGTHAIEAGLRVGF